jgi:hypothetical protein
MQAGLGMKDQSNLTARVQAWLAAREGEMTALLADLVNADSGTYNKAGVDAAGEVLQAFWRAHGLAVSVIPRERFGDVISRRSRLPRWRRTRALCCCWATATRCSPRASRRAAPSRRRMGAAMAPASPT